MNKHHEQLLVNHHDDEYRLRSKDEAGRVGRFVVIEKNFNLQFVDDICQRGLRSRSNDIDDCRDLSIRVGGLSFEHNPKSDILVVRRERREGGWAIKNRPHDTKHHKNLEKPTVEF